MKTALKISLVECRHVGDETRQAVGRVFRKAFKVDENGKDPLQSYFSKVKNLLLARSASDEVVGFQFYQEVSVSSQVVHHFSLAARLDDERFRGLQLTFGNLLIRRALRRTRPWRAVYLAGVTNDPRSYRNFHSIGRRSYPNVRGREVNPFGDFYFRVAESLGVRDLDERGVVVGRMRDIGFELKPFISKGGALAEDYDAYVGGERSDGVFNLVEVLPLVDVPLYLMRHAFGARP